MSIYRQGVLRKVALEGKCRTCLSTEGLTRHHLVPQFWFERQRGEVKGRHNPANIVPLCRRCHVLIDGRDEALRLLKRQQLRASLQPSELRFVRCIRGQAWLDHQYPETVSMHDGHRIRPGLRPLARI